jgi:hypothetical protein
MLSKVEGHCLTAVPFRVIIHTSKQGADMKRTDVEELLGKMEQFADFLFAQGKNCAGNELLGFIETADAVLEDCELEQE